MHETDAHFLPRSKQPWVGLPKDAEVCEEAIPPERLKAIFSLNLA
jgi:hypothetical protein